MRILLAFACDLGELGVVAVRVKRLRQQRLHVDCVGERLARRGAVASGEEVAAAKLFRREADRTGDLVHVAFEREQALRRAEAAERTVRRNVGGHRLCVHAQVRPLVGARGVDGAARKHDGRERGVGAAIDRKVDGAAEQLAVLRHGRAVTRTRRMSLGGGDHVFGAVVDHLDGMAALHRE